jgi:hypothetical protein
VSGLGLVGHNALDQVGLALLVDQELSDAAVPGSDVCEKFLQAFDASVGEGGSAFVGPIVDMDNFAVVDVVGVPADHLDQLEAPIVFATWSIV